MLVVAAVVGCGRMAGVDAEAGSDAGASTPLSTDCREGIACAQEGQTCPAPCSSACDFCIALTCSAGRWSTLGDPPPSCYVHCGHGATYCRFPAELCEHLGDAPPDAAIPEGGIRCEPLASPCASTPTCACLLANDPCAAAGRTIVSCEEDGGAPTVSCGNP